MRLTLAYLCAASAALAAPARDRTFSSYEEWASGQARNVEVWSPGGISRAGVVDSVLIEGEQYVWSVSPSRKGGVVLATGGGGKVYRFDGSTLTLVFDSPETDLLCVLEDPDGTLWAGSSPDGLVYRIRPNGSVDEFRTGASVVWALVRHGTEVLAGTGPEGKILACRPGKEPSLVARTAMENVLSLLSLPDGSLLAAGDSPCAIQRLFPDGSLMTIAQLAYDEARGLALLGSDSIGVLAVGRSAQGNPQSLLLTGGVDGPLVEQWTSPDSLALGLGHDPWGAIVVGGWPGRAYLVRDATTFRRIAEVGKDQIICVARSGSRLYFGASTPACLFWLEERRVKEGSWRSPVVDAGTVATWGKVEWMGAGTDVRLRVRTGNLLDPRTGWTEWKSTRREERSWVVSVPDARCAQFELTLREGERDRPAVEWLRVSYQPRNQRPAVTSFTLLERGQRPQGVSGRGSGWGGRSGTEGGGSEGDRYLVWTAADPDGDPLEFSLAFAPYPEGNWVDLGWPTEDTYRVITRGSLAEGWYRFRLVASDRLGNPPREAQTATAYVGPCLVDDTPPIVTRSAWERRNAGFQLTVRARDLGGGVARASVSIDGRTWIVMAPVDGVADSAEEEFSAFVPPPLASVSLRVEDRDGNGTTISLPPPR